MKRFTVSGLICAVVFLAVFAVRWAGKLEYLELLAYDQCMRLVPAARTFASPVVVVGLTEEDIGRLGHPLTDERLSELLEAIMARRPRAVGLDIFRDIEIPPGKEKLERTFLDHQNIIAGMKFKDEYGVMVPPPPVLAKKESEQDQFGFVDFPFDQGGTVRRGLLFLDDDEKTYSSLSLQLALLYLEPEGIGMEPDPVDESLLRLGKTTFSTFGANDGGYVGTDAAGYQFLLDFRGARAVKTFSFGEVLEGRIKDADLRDKVVLVGVTCPSLKDYVDTPLRELEFGVKVHAQAVDQLLRAALLGARPPGGWPDSYEAFWMLCWSTFGGALGLSVRRPARFAFSAVGGLVFLALLSYYLFARGLWIPVVPPAFTWFLSASMVTSYISYSEREERAVLMRIFSRHVAPDVAETIWRHRKRFLEGGRLRTQKLTATVLFTDLKGFTTLSETMDPAALMDWLNGYMESMAGHVAAHEGVVNKYQGDGIMAVFGVPVPHTTPLEIQRDAVNAVNCALAMRAELSGLHEKWRAQGFPPMAVRVGIHTGMLVSGSLGSKERLEYTVIGDTVNTASRLESHDKDLMDPDIAAASCRILIGPATYELVRDHFVTRHIGVMHLKGKEEPVSIYGVIGKTEWEKDWKKQPTATEIRS